MKNYKLLEHTADIYIRVKAKSLKELFQNSAGAVFEIMAEEKSPVACLRSPVRNITIKQKAEDLEELFLNWLNELLSLSAVKGLIFSKFKIQKLSENNLEAQVSGAPVKNYQINTEVKAATYHALKLKKTKTGWLAEVILDV